MGFLFSLLKTVTFSFISLKIFFPNKMLFLPHTDVKGTEPRVFLQLLFWPYLKTCIKCKKCISFESTLFAKTKTIFRERNTAFVLK